VSTEETAKQRAHRLAMEMVCAGIRDELVKAMKEEGLEGMGFAITLSDFGDAGMFAYASNIQRQDVIRLFRETIAKLEMGA
jgi:hypothetical protein